MFKQSKNKKFYNLRPKKEEMRTQKEKKEVKINDPLGETDKLEHEWLMYQHKFKKKDPPLIEHKQVFSNG